MTSNLIKLIILPFLLIIIGCKSENNSNHMKEVKQNKKSIEILWNNYIDENPEKKNIKPPISFYFCDNEFDANECADLVVKGTKRATATSLWWYQKNNESLPRVGDQYIITDWSGNAKAVIETTKIEQVPYNKITSEFAKIEGEGDKSLEYWKKVHKDYYTREMKPFNDEFSENMIIVCEHFKTVFTK
jgi:uncharacterized protein YhfF